MLFLDEAKSECQSILADLLSLSRGYFEELSVAPYNPHGIFWNPQHRRLLNDLSAWACKYDMVRNGEPADWCIVTAYTTAWEWSRYGTSDPGRPGLNWTFPGCSYVSLTHVSELPTPPGPFDCEAETEAAWVRRAVEYADAVKAIGIARGGTPASEIRSLDHYTWAAQFQVAKREVSAICDMICERARDSKIDPSTVNRAINKVLELIGLTRRASIEGRAAQR
jgi:hypothetical protein